MGVSQRTSPLSPWLLGCVAAGCIGIGWLVGLNPKYGLLAAVAVVFAAVVLIDLTIGFVAFTGLSFLDVLGGSSSLSPTKGIGLILFVSWLARIGTRRGAGSSFVAENPALAAALVAMVGWAALSFAWAASPGTALGGAARYLLVVMLVPIAFSALRERKHVVWVIAAFIGGAVFSCVYGFIVPASQASGFAGRLVGSLGDPNAEGAVLAAGIPLLIGLAGVFRGSARVRVAAIFGVPIMFAGLLGTLSREGLLALGSAMVAAVIFGGRWRTRAATLLVIGVACTSGYYFVLAPLAARQRVTMSDTSGRSSIWAIAGRIITAHPLLGVGNDNFILVESRYINQPGAIAATYIVNQPKVAHNSYLEALADLGIPGLLTMLAVLGGAIASVVRATWIFERLGDRQMELTSRALVLALTAVLTSDFFVSGAYEKYQWLLLALCPVMLALARRTAAQVGPAPPAADRLSPIGDRPA